MPQPSLLLCLIALSSLWGWSVQEEELVGVCYDSNTVVYTGMEMNQQYTQNPIIRSVSTEDLHADTL